MVKLRDRLVTDLMHAMMRMREMPVAAPTAVVSPG
jgi:hypothetical protein